MKIITVVMLALLSTNVKADTTLVEACNLIAYEAELIMEGRQRGVKASVFLSMPELDSDEVRAMIFRAYDTPLMHSEEMKDMYITEFSNDYMLMCMKSPETFY